MAKKEFKTQSKQLLELMIHSIYSNKEIFLRELISNASDALTKRNFEKLKGNINFDEELSIKIDLNKEERTISLIDNGIGMNEEDLDSFLGTIANSGTKLFMEKIENNSEDINSIGQFGVGFYSSYLVAKNVEVITKKENNDAFVWTSDGISSYEINKTNKDAIGTTIKLYLREGAEFDEFLDVENIKNLIKKHSDFISFPIIMDLETTAEDDKKVITPTTINSQKAIWKRNKNEVKDEDYADFYKSSFSDFMDPLFYFNANVEGTISFNLLTFIPSKNPYMNMMGEVKNTFKLYSKEVLIDNDASFLLPDYLKFVRGIVDCADLNLNISREMLQQDKVVTKLKKAIEKRIVKELSKLMKKDFDKYVDIWTSYSRELTFGVYNDFGAKKDLLQDLLLFKSTKDEKFISLATYVENNQDQENILYVVGNSIEVINKMPVMEQFEDSDKEVLYFLNDVDEFAIKALGEYKNKKFVSVSNFENDNEVKSQDLKNEVENSKEILELITKALKEEVEEVTLTDKLKSSPVKLSSKNEVSIEMEKTLQDNDKANHVKAQKVLEINMNHAIFKKLKKLDEDSINIYAKVLLDQAKLVEGLNISDPIEYVKLVNKLLSK